MPKIYLVAEHNGLRLKKYILQNAAKFNLEIIDLHPSFDPLDDYPIVATILAQKMRLETHCFGVAICGSGQGICIALNRFSHIRAANTSGVIDAANVRSDDNANVICLSGRVLDFELALDVVNTFVNTQFANLPRYQRRVEQLGQMGVQFQ